MMPLLVILRRRPRVYGGYIVAVKLMGTNPVIYMNNTFQFLDLNDIWSGLIKSSVFGLILTLTGCVQGYYTFGGAEGVGPLQRRGCRAASLYILLIDFFLNESAV